MSSPSSVDDIRRVLEWLQSPAGISLFIAMACAMPFLCVALFAFWCLCEPFCRCLCCCGRAACCFRLLCCAKKRKDDYEEDDYDNREMDGLNRDP